MNLPSCVCVLVFAWASVLSGCAPGKRPFLIAQVCLANAQDVSTFTSELRSIANLEGGRFVDDSENTQRDLHAIGNANVDKMISRPVINIGVERGHGVGLMAGNIGLGNGVAIGFSEGSNPPEARKFAQMVIRKLEERWHVEIVPNPAESGALPMKNCN
jgi:hypothetical protein